MIEIDLNLFERQKKYQISTTFFIFVIIPLAYIFYARYITKKPNKYNKLEEPVNITITIPNEAKPHWKGKRLYTSNMTVRLPNEPEKIQCYCPATGQYLGTYCVTSREDMDNQISQAKKAQIEWGKSSFSTRRRLLKTLKRYILENQDNIARIACRDSGKTKLDASMGEIMVTLEKINWIILNGEKTLRPSQRPGPSNLFMSYLKNAEVRYEPLGLVAALISWNYPFHNLMGPIVAALFTGNSIIVKCSEQVMWSSIWFVELVRTVLKQLDLNPDLVQLCCCYPEDADYFTSHPGISHLTFIGSEPVAHKVVTSAAKQLIPCVVELGGKDAVIVMDDLPDYNALSSVLMRGVFQSAGQNCIGIERIICLPKAFDTLVRILSSRVKELRLGSDIDQLDEIDLGAMISNNRFDHLEELVKDAVSKGAKLLHGGKRYQHPNYPQGNYFEPTLLVGVDSSMKIFHEEVFGPIMTIIEASNVDEAVEIANGTDYGLGNSVFGANFQQCSDIANRLQSGNVAINDFATYYVAQLPFGGVKKSGYGKFGGEEGLIGLCNAKSIIMDKPIWRALGVKTSIPAEIDYPIKDSTKAWNFLNALNIASYDSSCWEVLKALKKMAKGGT
ncbi:Piso0_003571 [Millerozyma farinosa CBS 7064]|uniref:Piso0_003571 protein n=1 Tax=Pichia sorbitophila (strain ATCC MYA-4447 / BCRC 22081 / CBS 7064 / NBRC 10061 / NRRL Y-12695) TaxID=559304 RepID=G8YJF9_PICSO|nr:Piso0_003571 [Millerozyma farinosa CBS 7064]CCE81219.1 Piso0_003571 [Millerozyma farinosa CBS 7064]